MQQINGKHNPNLNAKDELDTIVDLYGKEAVLEIWNSLKPENPDRFVDIPLITGTKGKDIDRFENIIETENL